MFDVHRLEVNRLRRRWPRETNSSRGPLSPGTQDNPKHGTALLQLASPSCEPLIRQASRAGPAHAAFHTWLNEEIYPKGRRIPQMKHVRTSQELMALANPIQFVAQPASKHGHHNEQSSQAKAEPGTLRCGAFAHGVSCRPWGGHWYLGGRRSLT